jgi:hypothetical protein
MAQYIRYTLGLIFLVVGITFLFYSIVGKSMLSEDNFRLMLGLEFVVSGIYLELLSKK